VPHNGLAAITISGLVLWLVFDGSAKQRRIDALDVAVAGRTIGRLTDEQTRRLEATVAEALDALGISIKVAVDRPFQAGILNIYTTSAAAKRVMQCGAGNALYDPELDAIFIDEQFFSNEGFKKIYESSGYSAVVSFKTDLVFPEVFLRFVILHEIGHRQLHRHLKGYRPDVSELPSTDLRNLEREADAFAITGMKKLYALDKLRGSPLVGKPLREAVGLSDFFNPNIDPGTQVYVDLVGALFMMADMNLYLATPYSPFFESSSHPTFLDRARSAIVAVLEDPTLDPKIRANFLFLRESLARESDVGLLAFREALVPGTISDVSFGPDGVLILGAGNSHLYRVPSAALATAMPPLGQRMVRVEVVGEGAASVDSKPNEAFWTRPDGSAIVVDNEGDAWIYAVLRSNHHDWHVSCGCPSRYHCDLWCFGGDRRWPNCMSCMHYATSEQNWLGHWPSLNSSLCGSGRI
jgi:hypothetical protein